VDFTNKSNNEGIDAAKQLLRKLLDEPTGPAQVPTASEIQSSQHGIDRSAELRAEANRIARQKAESMQKVGEQEQKNRQVQGPPNFQTTEKSPAQPPVQRQSSPKLFPIIAGISLLALFCLGGGYVLWNIFNPDPLTPVPTTEVPKVVIPPIVTTEPPPEPVSTTPAPPIGTIPSDPVDFIYFYFEKINERDYDLTWSLLSENYQNVESPGGKSSYENFWNPYTVTITSIRYAYFTDTSAFVLVDASTFPNDTLDFYLIRNNVQSNWKFNLKQDMLDATCRLAPKKLSIGHQAIVATANDTLTLRSDTTVDSDVIENMRPGTMVSVFDGPQCKYYSRTGVFYWWWRVESQSGKQGWVVEGADTVDPIFIQPIP